MWVRYHPLAPPANPSSGTTYIYGHACHHHTWPFTSLRQARIGDLIEVATPTGVITYHISDISTAYPEDGPEALNSQTKGISDPTIPNRMNRMSVEPGLEHLLGPAFDHVHQSGRARWRHGPG